MCWCFSIVTLRTDKMGQEARACQNKKILKISLLMMCPPFPAQRWEPGTLLLGARNKITEGSHLICKECWHLLAFWSKMVVKMVKNGDQKPRWFLVEPLPLCGILWRLGPYAELCSLWSLMADIPVLLAFAYWCKNMWVIIKLFSPTLDCIWTCWFGNEVLNNYVTKLWCH